MFAVEEAKMPGISTIHNFKCLRGTVTYKCQTASVTHGCFAIESLRNKIMWHNFSLCSTQSKGQLPQKRAQACSTQLVFQPVAVSNCSNSMSSACTACKVIMSVEIWPILKFTQLGFPACSWHICTRCLWEYTSFSCHQGIDKITHTKV